jgi:C4-dicarboxylate transporter, DctM subunit
VIFVLLLLGGLAVAGLPLYLVLSGVALSGFHLAELKSEIYFAELVRLAGNPALIAIPLFTLAGYILAGSKAPQRLVKLASALLGWLPGSLAVVTILVMALLAAFTGASGITIVALGGLMLPTLIQGGFRERFSLGLLTSSGSIGLLFPPSLPIILYGVVAETPIDKLFKAGIAPGLLMILAMSAYSVFTGIRIRKDAKVEPVAIWPALKEAIWEVPLPILVVGGIYGGVFTTSEAAVVMVAYLVMVETLLTRDLKFRELPKIMKESSLLIGEILLILGAALALTNYLVYADVPTILLDWIKGTLQSKWSFLLALNIFLLIIGSLMEIFSALVVVVPLILPLALKYGVDPIHLAIIFLANLEVGFCTPPFGLNLFIGSFRLKKPIMEMYRSVLPFLAIQLIILAIITYVPAFTLAPVAWFTNH